MLDALIQFVALASLFFVVCLAATALVAIVVAIVSFHRQGMERLRHYDAQRGRKQWLRGV